MGHGITNQAAEWARPDVVIERARAYIERCAAEAVGTKKHGRFANLAGFCCDLGVGVEAFERQMAAMPEERDLIGALLEDAALNSDLGATLLSSYLKKRLGYGDKAVEKHLSESGDLQLIFEHDVFEDGG